MSEICDLIGQEADLPRVARTIRLFAESIDTALLGGYHITCSDESEWECAQVFGQLFAQEIMPRLKMDRAAVFHTMSLGGRYECGAVHIAEQHFASFASQQSPKAIVVKINSHAAVIRREEVFRYGELRRYGTDSACCSELVAMLQGDRMPVAAELASLFGPNRLAALRDEEQTQPQYRALLAAVLNARLQAERIVDDIRLRPPASPTVYTIVPCVTINRDEPDNEILVGQYGVYAAGDEVDVKYQGLGDAPIDYRVDFENGLVRIRDAEWF